MSGIVSRINKAVYNFLDTPRTWASPKSKRIGRNAREMAERKKRTRFGDKVVSESELKSARELARAKRIRDEEKEAMERKRMQSEAIKALREEMERKKKKKKPKSSGYIQYGGK